MPEVESEPVNRADVSDYRKRHLVGDSGSG
jgi:hypothetical protein